MAGSAPSPSANTASQMRAYIQYLPQLLNVTNAAAVPTAESQYQAAQAVSPEYSQLGLQQLQQYAMPYADIGNQVANANALAGAQTQANVLQGPGAQAAAAADAIARASNPEYYATRSAAGAQANNLVNSINLGGLSGGETAAVERSLNQSNTATGNLGLDNATNAVSNAMNFGNYLNTKRTALGNALNTATGFMNTAQNTSFNPVATALSQPAATGTNFGTSQLTPVTTPGNQAMGFGQGLMGNINSTYNASMPLQAQASYQNSPLGVTTGILGSLPSCCFIFMEAYNGVLPAHVRVCRDWFYFHMPEVAIGYRRMARWLVPLMKQFTLIRWVVNKTMIKPITQHGAWILGIDGGKRNTFALNFWFGVWRKLAR